MTTILVPSRSQIETRMQEGTKQGDELETEENDNTRWRRNQENSINEIFTESTEMNNLSISKDIESRTSDKTIYRREANVGLTPLRYSRRSGGRGIVNRPLSGSSIASSTSSSGCSNQGNANAANPYLTSVESLADTCASSQGKFLHFFFFYYSFFFSLFLTFFRLDFFLFRARFFNPFRKFCQIFLNFAISSRTFSTSAANQRFHIFPLIYEIKLVEKLRDCFSSLDFLHFNVYFFHFLARIR